jgi:hypothetical protein
VLSAGRISIHRGFKENRSRQKIFSNRGAIRGSSASHLTESTVQLPEKTGPRDESIARLCRQICLCRTRGQIAQANRLEAVLRNQVSADFSEDALQEIFIIEQKRVIDALMLADVLGPLLTEHLAATADPARAQAPAARSSPRPVTPDEPLGIADLIEGMLVQERTTRGHAA